ncbi:MAG: trypsin-like peptidase domain-containing protein [Chromatiales bacterium]
MKFHRLLSFLLTSVTAGLAAAIVVIMLRPDILEKTPAFREPAAVGAAPRSEGPVSYARAVEEAAPSVVSIYTTKIREERSSWLLDDPMIRRFFGSRIPPEPRKRLETSLGSGVIVSTDGYILTNNHVIEGADQIRVMLPGGQELEADVVGTDPDTDLAVLRTRSGELPVAIIGRSAGLEVGDVVLAIGNPFAVGQTVTMGIVSATGRTHLGINTFENFIQTDAAINPGNSGGALVNAHGELVGINTAIFSRSGGSHGIGFAIPIDLAKGVMEQIVREGRMVRGWIGITAQDVTPQLAESFGLHDAEGVLVSGVMENGPAERAGLRPGDVITQIDDQPTSQADDILNVIATQTPGSRISVRGWRGNDPIELEAVVTERPPGVR